jgi:hypothetical protein
LHTNNEQAKKKIGKTISFTIASKIKYLGINLRRKKTSTMKTVKHWRKKVKKTLEDGNTANVPGLGRLML